MQARYFGFTRGGKLSHRPPPDETLNTGGNNSGERTCAQNVLRRPGGAGMHKASQHGARQDSDNSRPHLRPEQLLRAGPAGSR